MDAYCDYVRQLTEARLTELRREADEYRLVRSLTASRASRGSGLGARLRRRAERRAAAKPIAAPVRLPRPMTAPAPFDEDVRRTA